MDRWVSWSLGLRVSASLGHWATGPLGLWFSGPLGLLVLWASGSLGLFSCYFAKFARISCKLGLAQQHFDRGVAGGGGGGGGLKKNTMTIEGVLGMFLGTCGFSLLRDTGKWIEINKRSVKIQAFSAIHLEPDLQIHYQILLLLFFTN